MITHLIPLTSVLSASRVRGSTRLSTALDVDDLLLECIPYAIQLANEKYKFDPPLTIYEVDRWGTLGTRADVIFEFLADMENNTDFSSKEQEKRFNFTLFEHEDYPVHLHGIIDRIDMTHDMLRILDYKSSHKSLSASKIKSGLQLQLLTYLYAASCIYQKTAAGCYYVSLKNDDLKAPESKVDGRRFEIIDPSDNQDQELWTQSHRLDGMTFENTNMLDFDGRHIKNFKNGKPSKVYSFDDLSGFVHAIYDYLASQLANGNISLTPTEDACMFCDHFSICRFHKLKVKSIVPEEIASRFFKEVKTS